MTPDCTITVRNSAEVIAVAPYVIGFHPTDSIVVIGVDHDTVTFGVRYDLPPPGDDGADMAMVIARQAVQHVVVLGYGPPAGVTDAVLGLAHALARRGVVVSDAIRVADGRWWPLLCTDPLCCPADGHPCPQPDTVGTAAAVFGGRVALPDRHALVAQVSPVDGEARSAMAAATERAEKRLDDLAVDDRSAGRSVLRAGRAAVREAERALRSGRELTDDEVAWLGLLLVDPRVLDYGLDRSGGDEWRARLWTAVLRRVEPDFVTGPACLLAFAAWQRGDGALARVAIDRGLRADPRHHTTVMLDRLLRSGLGPSALVALRPPAGPRPPVGPRPSGGPFHPEAPGRIAGWRQEDGLGIERRDRRDGEADARRRVNGVDGAVGGRRAQEHRDAVGRPGVERESAVGRSRAGSDGGAVGRSRAERDDGAVGRSRAGLGDDMVGRLRVDGEVEGDDWGFVEGEPDADDRRAERRARRDSGRREEGRPEEGRRDAGRRDAGRRQGRARGTGDGRRQSRSTRRRSL
jgi:hypothetical protein